MASYRRPAFLGIGLTLLAWLHFLWASRIPVGIYYDDALHLLLARAVLAGSFALPDGRVLTDPLPGFALLLAIPVKLFEPHWGLLRYLALACLWLAILLSYKLARKFLPRGWALAAGGLVAVNTGLMMFAGALMPDIAYAAVSLALFIGLSGQMNVTRLLALACGASLAALLRPQGLILVLSLALAVAASQKVRRAAVFLAAALCVPSAWALRCLAVANSSGGYFGRWRAELLALLRPADMSRHAARLSAVLGGGMLSAANLPSWACLVAGAAILGLAGWGAKNQQSRENRPRVLAMAAYAAGVLVLHLTWRAEGFRYFLPLLPLLWIFALCAVRPFAERHRALGLGLGGVLAAAALFQDLAFLPAGGSAPTLWPATMEWIRANTPASARFQAIYDAPLMLFTGRPAVGFTRDISTREQWLAQCSAQHVGYALINEDVARGTDWFRPDSRLALIHRDPAEGSLLFELNPE